MWLLPHDETLKGGGADERYPHLGRVGSYDADLVLEAEEPRRSRQRANVRAAKARAPALGTSASRGRQSWRAARRVGREALRFEARSNLTQA